MFQFRNEILHLGKVTMALTIGSLWSFLFMSRSVAADPLRASAIEEIQRYKPQTSSRSEMNGGGRGQSGKSPSQSSTQSVGSQELLLSFDDPNPRHLQSRQLSFSLLAGRLGPQSAYNVEFDSAYFFEMGFGALQEWSSLDARLFLSRQNALGALSERTQLQTAMVSFNALLHWRPAVTRVLQFSLGLSAGSRQLAVLSSRSLLRASQTQMFWAPVFELAVFPARDFSIVGRMTKRQVGQSEILPAAQTETSIGGRLEW